VKDWEWATDTKVWIIAALVFVIWVALQGKYY
jgi:hypothetical protein